MAKIYSVQKTVAPPKFDRDMVIYRANIQAYKDAVKALCKAKSRSKDELVGEELRIPMADGYAFYMVYDIKPLTLVHLEIGDAYHHHLADQLTVKRVREMIATTKRYSEIFK